MRLTKAMAWATTAIALALGSIGLLNTMAMTVFERTGEIGLLRALGWKRRRVVLLLLGEAAGLGLLGVLAGSVLAFAGARSVGNAVTLVAIRDALPSAQLRVQAASDPAFIGLHVRPGDGVFGRVTRSLTPVSDRVSACEPEVAARVRPYGQRVLAAPIAM